jgi:hypothetical protein
MIPNKAPSRAVKTPQVTTTVSEGGLFVFFAIVLDDAD